MDAQRLEHAITLRNSGHVEEALRELAAMTESTTDPGEKASLLVNEARCYRLQGRLAEARKQLSHACHIAPKTQGLLYLDFEDAVLYWHEGKRDKALDILERLHDSSRGLLLTPEHRELYHQIQTTRGMLLAELKRFREACPLLEESLSFDPLSNDKAALLYNLGLCYRDLGQPERGKEKFLEALANCADPTYLTLLHYELGTIYFDEAAYPKALTEFEACLAGAEQARLPQEHVFKWLAATSRRAGLRGEAEKYETLSRKQ